MVGVAIPESLDGKITKPMTAILAACLLREKYRENLSYLRESDKKSFINGDLMAALKRKPEQVDDIITKDPIYMALSAYAKKQNPITRTGASSGSLKDTKQSPEVGF